MLKDNNPKAIAEVRQANVDADQVSLLRPGVIKKTAVSTAIPITNKRANKWNNVIPVPTERDKAIILEKEITVIIRIPFLPNNRKLANIIKRRKPTSSQETCFLNPSRIDVRLLTWSK